MEGCICLSPIFRSSLKRAIFSCGNKNYNESLMSELSFPNRWIYVCLSIIYVKIQFKNRNTIALKTWVIFNHFIVNAIQKRRLKKFAKFKAKHQSWSSFLIKVQTHSLQLYKKRDPVQVFPYEFLENFQSSFIGRRPVNGCTFYIRATGSWF